MGRVGPVRRTFVLYDPTPVPQSVALSSGPGLTSRVLGRKRVPFLQSPPPLVLPGSFYPPDVCTPTSPVSPSVPHWSTRVPVSVRPGPYKDPDPSTPTGTLPGSSPLRRTLLWCRPLPSEPLAPTVVGAGRTPPSSPRVPHDPARLFTQGRTPPVSRNRVGVGPAPRRWGTLGLDQWGKGLG